MTIQKSNNSDLRQILDWLKSEHAAEGRGFHSNAEMIEEGHQKNDQLLVLKEGEAVVAFALGKPGAIDIFEVRPGYRRKGRGKLLAQYCIDRAANADVVAIEFECSPATSLPFWRAMGFSERSPRWGGCNPWVIMKLSKPLDLPAGKPAKVVIRILSEDFAYDPDYQPIEVFEPEAIRDRDGIIWLAKRIPIVAPELPNGKDVAVEIIVDGTRVLIGKAKHEGPRGAGVQADRWGNFYLDRILPEGARETGQLAS